MTDDFPPVAGVEHRFVEAGGLRMHVAEAGAGEPLLLLHGWPQHWYQWRGVIQRLAGTRRVIVPDLRGFGWTDAPPGPVEPDVFVRDVIALLDALGIEQTDLAGHDWGGFTAMLLAARHPERFRKVVALSAPHPWIEITPRLALETWRAWYALPLAAGLMERTPKLAAWFIRREGVPAEDVADLRRALRDPARAAATTRLYRSYLRTLRDAVQRRAGGAAHDRPAAAHDRRERHGRDARGWPRGWTAAATTCASNCSPAPGTSCATRTPTSWPSACAPSSERAACTRLSGRRATPKVSACDTVSSLGAVLALLAWPATGHAQSGGASVPAPTGGAGYGIIVPRLVASRFTVDAAHDQAGRAGQLPLPRRRLAPERARARRRCCPIGSRHPAARIRMGWKRTGRTLTRSWTPPAGKLTPGDYVARLHAVDRARPHAAPQRHRVGPLAADRRRARAAPAPVGAPAPVAPAVGSGIFPVQGAFTYGDGFGVKRGTATHRGQDILAASGTPVVTPRAGTVTWRAYQADGAGHYVVIHADDGRDFVFMHLLDGSITVAKGDTVTAGQVFAQVGQTGHATAPHLHFEIWPDGWYASDESQPIDPRPDLDAWAAG